MGNTADAVQNVGEFIGIADADFQKIVMGTGDFMDLLNFRDFSETGGNLMFAGAFIGGKFDQHRQVQAQFTGGEADFKTVDHPGPFQPAHPFQNSGWCQIQAAGDFCIGDAPILLQSPQNIQIGLISLAIKEEQSSDTAR